MAINLEQKNNDNSMDTKKILLIVLLIAFAILAYFLFFKDKGGSSTQSMSSATQSSFAPVNIDFEFLSSDKVSNLDPFSGIPVLPGFYTASDKQIEPEKIDYGRENPFEEVTKEEIEAAIYRVIESLEEEKDLGELKQSITNSTLYNTSQKQAFIDAIDAKIELIQEEVEALEEANKDAMEIVLDEQTIEEIEEEIEEEVEEVIEESEDEDAEEETNFKVW
jgi:hypothetical protein